MNKTKMTHNMTGLTLKMPDAKDGQTEIILTDNLDELLAIGEQERRNYYCIGFCQSGSCQLDMDDKTHILHKDDLLVFLPYLFSANYMRTPDFSCVVLALRESFFRDIVMDCLRSEPKWLEKQQYIQDNPVIMLNDFQRELYMSYLSLFQVYLRGQQDDYRRQIIHSLTRAATLEIMSYLDGQVKADSADFIEKNPSQKDIILRDFLNLLRQSGNTHREVKWYAEQLNITPKYLSAVCKERSGRTAMDWITEFMVDECKKLLAHSNMTVKEVAYQLGFSDVSFFCQYIRKHTGMTPQSLRYAK